MYVCVVMYVCVLSGFIENITPIKNLCVCVFT
jgi:hypothetical protein